MEKITQIYNYNLGQLLELLDAYNVNDGVKKAVKSYFWKTKDEIIMLLEKEQMYGQKNISKKGL